MLMFSRLFLLIAENEYQFATENSKSVPNLARVYKWLLFSAFWLIIVIVRRWCLCALFSHFPVSPPIKTYCSICYPMCGEIVTVLVEAVVPSMINVIVTGFLPTARWTGSEPFRPIVKCMALEKMSSWGQSMHITADWRAPPAQHCVDRHAQYFSLLRKGLVYSAGNDPNPADICPTGRGALTQVCHFISTVKSIKSTHTEGLFFHACTVFVSFLFIFFLCFFRWKSSSRN